jgi:hypothetical protein
MPSAPAGYFFDNNESVHVAEALRILGEPVHHMRHLFPAGDPGEPVWLPEVGKRDLVVVTYDLAIARTAQEIALYVDSGVGGVFLPAGHAPGRCERIEQMIRRWRFIKKVARENDRPFMFKLRQRGFRLESLLRR